MYIFEREKSFVTGKCCVLNKEALLISILHYAYFSFQNPPGIH